MKPRREFLRLSAAAALLGLSTRSLRAQSAPSAAMPNDADPRGRWSALAGRLAGPVLTHLAARTLKQAMPVEAHASSRDRPNFTYLEAFGRLLAGLAPWLELGGDATAEGRERARLTELARQGIDAATDPQSPDFMNFSKGAQPLVDAAFLAQALLRAPTELWQKLDARVQRNVIAALVSSRVIKPGENNWLLFASEVEIFLHRIGEKRDDARLFDALQKHRTWYVGDGAYGDGPEFHWDFYNSFVIQPMLLDALDVVGHEGDEWKTFHQQVKARLTRWAQVQERMIAPDGSFPALGRSLAYRCGAFQGLALAAQRDLLPKDVAPAQARVGLTRVIERTLLAPGTFDANGWLRIGLAGQQPSIGERYISTGSLYLCSVAFLPLGLPAAHAFWSTPAVPTTWEKVWSGQDLPADQALKGR